MPFALGIDVGGTKTAAGVVDLAKGRVCLRRQQPTLASRSGEAVLADVFALAQSVLAEARAAGSEPASIGIGVAELVSPSGTVVSDATIRWNGLPVRERFEALLPTTIDADVRAAARAEASFGAGAGLTSFVFVTVGTGISSCLVIDGEPYRGARGLTGTFASAPSLIPSLKSQLSTFNTANLVEGPPLEQFASGSALALRYRRSHPQSTAEAPEVLSLAEAADPIALEVVRSAGLALGAAIAQLVNTLDPEAVVLGGGLGLAEGIFRMAVEQGFRSHLWSQLHAGISLCSAKLGADAALIGAALGSAILRQHEL